MIRMQSSVPKVFPVDDLSITLPDGTVVTGKPQHVLTLIQKLGQPLPMYESSTKGSIPICSMATAHLRNAILKSIQTWASALRNLADEYVAEELKTFCPSDKELADLIAEFRKRRGTT